MDVSINLSTASSGLVRVTFSMRGHKFQEIMHLDAALCIVRDRARR